MIIFLTSELNNPYGKRKVLTRSSNHFTDSDIGGKVSTKSENKGRLLVFKDF